MCRVNCECCSHSRICGLSCPLCNATDELPGWASVPAILARIQEPRFASRDFTITDYGGVGDGRADCKAAFNKAIALVAKPEVDGLSFPLVNGWCVDQFT